MTIQINNLIKLAIALSIVLTGSGCTSVVREVGELRVSVYKTYYNAFDQSAKNAAQERCQEQQAEAPEVMDALAFEQCLTTEYQQRMAFYMSTMNKGIQNSSARETTRPGYGTKVYRADECVGAIVNGVCHGSILPKTANHPTCHGQMINGQCTGPMF